MPESGRTVRLSPRLRDSAGSSFGSSFGCMTDDVKAKAGTLFFSTRDEGTGVGLANCRRLIERASGTLEIESKAGSGTTVTVRVPRATTSP